MTHHAGNRRHLIVIPTSSDLVQCWDMYFEITDPEEAWNFVLKRITKLLDDIMPN